MYTRIFATAVVVLSAFILVGCQVTPTVIESDTIEIVTWCITPHDGNQICIHDPVEPGETAEHSLIEVDDKSDDLSIELEQSEYGAFITAVNGYTPDINSEFWKLIINDADAQVGISSYEIMPEDRLDIVLDEFDASL